MVSAIKNRDVYLSITELSGSGDASMRIFPHTYIAVIKAFRNFKDF
jgi:hypothetical protein